jgi:HK97 family phage major capsid protein
MNALELKGAEIEAKRKGLAEIFSQYPDYSFPAGEKGDTILADIQARNKELADLATDYQRLLTVAQAADANSKALAEYTRPAPVVGHNGAGEQPAAESKSLGHRFADALQSKGFKPDGRREISTEMPDVDFKTLMTESAGFAPPNNRGPIVQYTALRRPVVADLVPQDTTTDTVIKWMLETTFTNNAAATAEGATKPESALVFTEQSTLVEKISTWIPVTTEQIDDVPQLRGIINNRLTVMLKLTEETELLTGSGTPPHLTGFLNTSGIQTQAKGADPTPTAIYKAITLVRFTGFAEPSGVVMHPNDWQDIRTLQDTTGRYIWGDPWVPGPEQIWGLPVVVTPAMTQNTAFLGDFGLYSHISRRQGVTMAVSNSHSTYFVENKQAILIEERLSLEVYRPTAFATVTGI